MSMRGLIHTLWLAFLILSLLAFSGEELTYLIIFIEWLLVSYYALWLSPLAFSGEELTYLIIFIEWLLVSYYALWLSPF